MKVDIEIVNNFISLNDDLSKIVKAYGMKHKFIADNAKIPLATYYRKRRTGNFTGKEMKKIIEVINGDF